VWVAESNAGHPQFLAKRETEQHLLIEQVGARLRAKMSFLDPVTVVAASESAESAAVAGAH